LFAGGCFCADVCCGGFGRSRKNAAKAATMTATIAATASRMLLIEIEAPNPIPGWPTV
jgi:hypothetical protein